jgi:hypothetical protein
MQELVERTVDGAMDEGELLRRNVALQEKFELGVDGTPAELELCQINDVSVHASVREM